MSRIDHIFNRRQQGPQKVRGRRTIRVVSTLDNSTGKIESKPMATHFQGDRWWKLRWAQMRVRKLMAALNPETPTEDK